MPSCQYSNNVIRFSYKYIRSCPDSSANWYSALPPRFSPHSILLKSLTWLAFTLPDNSRATNIILCISVISHIFHRLVDGVSGDTVASLVVDGAEDGYGGGMESVSGVLDQCWDRVCLVKKGRDRDAESCISSAEGIPARILQLV